MVISIRYLRLLNNLHLIENKGQIIVFAQPCLCYAVAMQRCSKINNPLNLIHQGLSRYRVDWRLSITFVSRASTTSRGRQHYLTSTRGLGMAPSGHFGGIVDADNPTLTILIPTTYSQERQDNGRIIQSETTGWKNNLDRMPNLLITKLDVDRPKGDPGDSERNRHLWSANERVDGGQEQAYDSVAKLMMAAQLSSLTSLLATEYSYNWEGTIYRTSNETIACQPDAIGRVTPVTCQSTTHTIRLVGTQIEGNSLIWSA